VVTVLKITISLKKWEIKNANSFLVQFGPFENI